MCRDRVCTVWWRGRAGRLAGVGMGIHYLILQKNIHRDITVQDKLQLFHSGQYGDIDSY